MYFNINKLVMQADKKNILEAIWLGIKIAAILIPTFWAFGYFVLGK